MPEFTYEIVKHLGIISEGAGGWAKELNLISWNGKEPKYDIRDWLSRSFLQTRNKLCMGMAVSVPLMLLRGD